MAGITRERYEEIQEAAQRLVASYGIEHLDSINSQPARKALLVGFAHQLAESQEIGYQTARGHVAKACRRLRSPDYRPANWGGDRRSEIFKENH